MSAAERREKLYVGVEAYFDPEGGKWPRAILWPDGRRYEIDRVLDVRPAASLKAGGAGTRYTCRIRGRSTYLFYELCERWFVERKLPPPASKAL